ncbi:acyl-CoA dehydrogenase family protein [Magnetospira thiophila]
MAVALQTPGPYPALPATKEDMLAAVQAVAETDIRSMAVPVDVEGIYPGANMVKLAQAGAFAQHVTGFGYHPGQTDLLDTIEAMTVAGRECGNTSFLMWLQNAFAWYLLQSENTALRDELLEKTVTGQIMGTSGMSNPVKSMDGIESFKLKGQRVDGGYVVSGVLPYVSNLGDNHYMGSAFEMADDPKVKKMAVFHINGDDVQIRQNTHFIALEGSGTYSVLVKKAFIPDSRILAEDMPAYVKRIKPAFFLMQAGIALGQIHAFINIMKESDKSLYHVNQYLPDRAETFEAELAAALPGVIALLKTPLDSSPEYLKKVFETRLYAGDLTMRAANAALLHEGAKGYIQGSTVDRRFRESIFVAIVTPATKHLRKAIADLGV